MFLFPFDLDVALRRFLNYKVRPLIHLVACPVQYLRVPGDSWVGASQPASKEGPHVRDDSTLTVLGFHALT